MHATDDMSNHAGATRVLVIEDEQAIATAIADRLPGLHRLDVCRRIQRDRPVPVLMLTARDEETDMLVGLGVGADDYMTKPFSPRGS